MDSNHVLLASLGLRTDRKFWSSISDKDYTYLSGLSKEAQQVELAELAYHTRWESDLLDVGTIGRGMPSYVIVFNKRGKSSRNELIPLPFRGFGN